MQEWMYERASMLRYTNTACRVTAWEKFVCSSQVKYIGMLNVA
jgi:hypothetical protein